MDTWGCFLARILSDPVGFDPVGLHFQLYQLTVVVAVPVPPALRIFENVTLDILASLDVDDNVAPTRSFPDSIDSRGLPALKERRCALIAAGTHSDHAVTNFA